MIFDKPYFSSEIAAADVIIESADNNQNDGVTSNPPEYINHSTIAKEENVFFFLQYNKNHSYFMAFHGYMYLYLF